MAPGNQALHWSHNRPARATLNHKIWAGRRSHAVILGKASHAHGFCASKPLPFPAASWLGLNRLTASSRVVSEVEAGKHEQIEVFARRTRWACFLSMLKITKNAVHSDVLDTCSVRVSTCFLFGRVFRAKALRTAFVCLCCAANTNVLRIFSIRW